jgi:hypothetical protein
MKWRLGIFIVVALILLIVGLAWPRRAGQQPDASIQRMPVYVPPMAVDPRMPTMQDSTLPLGRDSSRRRAPPPRGWRR